MPLQSWTPYWVLIVRKMNMWFQKSRPVDDDDEFPTHDGEPMPLGLNPIQEIHWLLSTIDDKLTVQDDVNKVLKRQNTRLKEVVHKQRRDFWIAVTLFAVLFAGVCVVGWQNHKNAVAACESSNNRLDGTRADKQEEYRINDASAKAQGFQEDGPIRTYYKDRLKWQLEELYPYRDCSDLSEEIPVPEDPPSFDDALEAYLKQQERDDR